MVNLKTLCLVLGLSLSLSACSSSEKSSSSSPDTSETGYPKVVKKYTTHTQKYDGFHQSFGAQLTILNSEVNVAILNRRSQFFNWTPEELRQEREKSFQEMAAYSKFFLSFYSPTNDYDDLSKPNTMWKIFLETNGQRYEGKAKKDNSKKAELQQLFPYLDRFHTPYMVTFEVPMSAVEQQSAKVILTSSLGEANFEFLPVDSK